MNENDFIAIIPARYASTRFPGKPLAKIGDKTMIERVYKQVKKSVECVWVATDDDRIAEEVRHFQGNVVMTSPTHASGTDRLCEAAKKIANPSDIIINVQGDEPFIDPSQIDAIKECFSQQTTRIATLVRPFDKNLGFSKLQDPNLVKAVISEDSYALYFSRSVIPYLRGIDEQLWPERHQYYSHIGLYAYRYSTLMEIAELKRSALEKAESLEQLRWLENGYQIKVAITNTPTIGIDTPADLEEANRFVKTLSESE